MNGCLIFSKPIIKPEDIGANLETSTLTVTWVDYDNTVIKTEYVVYGDPATPPVDPYRAPEGGTYYIFSGWDKNYSNIVADTTITAVYSIEEDAYIVTFVNYDGTVLYRTGVAYGTNVVYQGEVPKRESSAALGLYILTPLGHKHK